MTNPEFSQLEQGVVFDERTTVQQLKTALRRGGVHVDRFGMGPAKTIENLLDEIHEGESTITVKSNGEILRELRVVWVDVFCELSNGDVYRLREDRQEFKDGREDNIKRRTLDSSLGEKLKADEAPEVAVMRALEEELGIKEIISVQSHGSTAKVLTPDTYPGLESSYIFYKFETVIPESAFNPEGYIEDQPDKTNYYVWDLVQNS